MKKSLNSIVVLVTICAVVSILMALTNSITAPIISQAEQDKANAALLDLLPDGGNFEPVDLSKYNLPSTVTEVYTAENGGYVVKLEITGYKPGMVIMCGIGADNTVVGTEIITHNETEPGKNAFKTFPDAVVGKTVDDIDKVDTISGATMTTKAYRTVVKDALNTAIILGGGSVDIRTEEEILRDNLSAALEEAEGAFTKHFFVEIVEGVDAIYAADNGAGYVCVIGEQFIGVEVSGTVLTECSEADALAAKTATEIIGATTMTEIDITAYEGLPSHLISAKLTNTGNYVIEIKGAGFGIKNTDQYIQSSGEYIIIRVSMTAEGRIIDCLTVSQAESKGWGDICAEESFYGQFDGKTEENYQDVDVVTEATTTVKGYKEAILRAFDSVKIFEEGNK